MDSLLCGWNALALFHQQLADHFRQNDTRLEIVLVEVAHLYWFKSCLWFRMEPGPSFLHNTKSCSVTAFVMAQSECQQFVMLLRNSTLVNQIISTKYCISNHLKHQVNVEILNPFPKKKPKTEFFNLAAHKGNFYPHSRYEANKTAAMRERKKVCVWDIRWHEISELGVGQCWRSGRNETLHSHPCLIFINLPLVLSCPSGWSEEEKMEEKH